MRNAATYRAEDSAAISATVKKTATETVFTDTRRLSVAQLLNHNDEVVARHYGAEVLNQRTRSR